MAASPAQLQHVQFDHGYGFFCILYVASVQGTVYSSTGGSWGASYSYIWGASLTRSLSLTPIVLQSPNILYQRHLPARHVMRNQSTEDKENLETAAHS